MTTTLEAPTLIPVNATAAAQRYMVTVDGNVIGMVSLWSHAQADEWRAYCYAGKHHAVLPSVEAAVAYIVRGVPGEGSWTTPQRAERAPRAESQAPTQPTYPRATQAEAVDFADAFAKSFDAARKGLAEGSVFDDV